MNLEQMINYQLNKFPKQKKRIKSIYQHGMYALSKKIKAEGKIERISPKDSRYEYFFGYYDKSPWDISDRYVICLRAKNTWTAVSPRETADIILIDTEKAEGDPERIKKIAETRTWNVQQGCMLQWLGQDFSSRILYNDYRNGRYVSVIYNLKSNSEKVIMAPVYSVSADGKFALTLDFSRLYELRPGYGYYNVPEKTKGIALPDSTAIWKIDLETGKVSDVLKYTDFANFQPRIEMQDATAIHKVNHIMLSPSGKRFMVIYRWFVGTRKYSRLITCNIDGSDMYLVSDDDMVSHCCWKNDTSILAFENKRGEGIGYYLMKDKTQKFVRCWKDLSNDGHPSYSPDGKLVVTDTYPDRRRISSIKIMEADEGKREPQTIAKVFSPFKYDNDTRCDLHPRWSHNSKKICFDAVFEGHRGVYTVDTVADVDEDAFDMRQIRFIMPLHGFYNQLIQKSGYDIKDPYNGNSLIKRIFREVDFRISLLKHERWYNCENVTNKKYIIVFEPLITPEYMEWLHKKNPESRIILFYINKLNNKNNPKKFNREWCEMWTADITDSKTYNINLYPYISYFKFCKVEKVTPIYDIFFVGKDKGRINDLINMEKAFNALGLTTYCHIVPEKRFSLRRNKYYKPFMPYDEVLKNIGRSKAILHLVNGGQVGITMRVMEALVHKVKLVTDCKEMMNYDFYTPENIFILGVDDFEKLPEFINSPYVEVQSKMFDRMYFEDMIEAIIKHDF